MDMLILGPFDTLKTGQRSRVMGTMDLWENSKDKSKAWWTGWKVVILKRRYFLFCPNWMFPLLEMLLLRVNQRKKEENTISSSCCLLLSSTVIGQDSEVYLQTSESSFASKTHTKPHGARAALMCARESLYFYIQLNQVLMRRPAELETTSWAHSQPVLGKLLSHLRWRTWRHGASFTERGYQLFIRN